MELDNESNIGRNSPNPDLSRTLCMLVQHHLDGDLFPKAGMKYVICNREFLLYILEMFSIVVYSEQCSFLVAMYQNVEDL